MADDKDDKVDADEAPEQEAAQEQPAEAAEAAPSLSGGEDIAKALRATLEGKLAELGLSRGEDGKWDPKSLSSDQLKAGTELIGSLLSNLASGVAAAAQQVRVDGVKPAAGDGDDKVIDLDAARRERDAEAKPRQPSALETRLVGNLRDTFNQFVLEHGASAGTEGDRPKVAIDNDFVRNHGGKLLGALFSSFAGSLLPPDFEFGAKTTDAPAAAADEDAAAATEDAGDAGDAASEAGADDQDVKVQLNVDLPGLFRDLFMGKQPPPED